MNPAAAVQWLGRSTAVPNDAVSNPGRGGRFSFEAKTRRPFRSPPLSVFHRGIRRTGWVLRGIPDPERISGHMYRMSVMAMMLGNDPDAGVNKDKCIRMALVHDMGECIVGDITPTCGVSKEEKFRRESEAMDSLARLVDNVSAAEFKSLWEEYEAQSSPESKVVKDLDMFDMILQAHEYEVELQDPGRLQEFFDSTNGRFQHHIVKQWSEELYKLRASHLSHGEK